jgi:hypothetical protein
MIYANTVITLIKYMMKLDHGLRIMTEANSIELKTLG